MSELHKVPFLPPEFRGLHSRRNWNFPRLSLVHIGKGPNTEMVQPTTVLHVTGPRLLSCTTTFSGNVCRAANLWGKLNSGEQPVFGHWAESGRCRVSDTKVPSLFHFMEVGLQSTI